MIGRTPDIMAQLVCIKHTFQIAKSFAAKGDPASRIVATILMDYVAESALKTVYWRHPKASPIAEEVKFGQLLKKVVALDENTASLARQAEIDTLHAQRNLTQHRNLVPSAEDVPKNAVHVEAFLRDVFARFFAVDLDALSLSSLVTHDELREHLATAERLTAQHRYEEGVSESALALSKAILGADKLLKVTDSWFRPGSMRSDAQRAGLTRDQADLLGELAEAIDRLRDDVGERLRVIALGLDYSSYMKYKAAAPFVSWTFDGSAHVHHTEKQYSPDQAAAIFDYVLNQILALETMGALPDPVEEE